MFESLVGSWNFNFSGSHVDRSGHALVVLSTKKNVDIESNVNTKMTVFPKSGGLAEPAAAGGTRSDTACQIKTFKSAHLDPLPLALVLSSHTILLLYCIGARGSFFFLKIIIIIMSHLIFPPGTYNVIYVSLIFSTK